MYFIEKKSTASRELTLFIYIYITNKNSTSRTNFKSKCLYIKQFYI